MFLGLALATILAWENRFQIVDHGINQFDLESYTTNDSKLAQERHFEWKKTEGGFTRIGPRTKGKLATLPIQINTTEIDYLLVRADYRYTQVVPGEEKWLLARGVFSDMHNGKWYHPPDSLLFEGTGSENWTNIEVIREISFPGRITQLNFGMLGKSGTLDIRGLRFAKLTQKDWFFPISTILGITWFLWFFFLIKNTPISGIIRPTITSGIVFVTVWFLIFPQANTFFFSITNKFPLKLPAVIKKDEIAQTPKPPPAQKIQQPTPAIQAPPPSKTTTAPPTPTVPTIMNRPAGSETRKALGSLHQKINTFAREKDWIHSAVFTLLTLVLLFFCGTDRILIIVFAIAVFAEVIPPLIRYGFDIGDLADLFTNLLGMGIGLMIWKLTSPLFSRWIPWLRKPATS